VFGEGGTATDVPVTPETTCRDLVECTRDPGDDQCTLVEIWRDCGKYTEEIRMRAFSFNRVNNVAKETRLYNIYKTVSCVY
jgi:hypothetical protein